MVKVCRILVVAWLVSGCGIKYGSYKKVTYVDGKIVETFSGTMGDSALQYRMAEAHKKGQQDAYVKYLEFLKETESDDSDNAVLVLAAQSGLSSNYLFQTDAPNDAVINQQELTYKTSATANFVHGLGVLDRALLPLGMYGIAREATKKVEAASPDAINQTNNNNNSNTTTNNSTEPEPTPERGEE